MCDGDTALSADGDKAPRLITRKLADGSTAASTVTIMTSPPT